MLLPVALRAQITSFPWSDDFSDSAASMNTWTISPAGSFDVMTAVGNMAEGSMVSLGVSGTMTSPAFTLPANANGYKMTYYVYGELPYLDQGAVGYYFVTVNTTTTTDTVDTYYCYTNGFERVSIDLEEYAGQTITVSFQHAANYSILAIDDFKIGPTSAPLYYVSGASVAQLNTPYTYVANHVEGDTPTVATPSTSPSRLSPALAFPRSPMRKALKKQLPIAGPQSTKMVRRLTISTFLTMKSTPTPAPTALVLVTMRVPLPTR